MIFRQELDTKSSTYTYIIASAKGREAVIIDPVRDDVFIAGEGTGALLNHQRIRARNKNYW